MTCPKDIAPPGADFCEGNLGAPALLDALMAKACPEAVLHFCRQHLGGGIDGKSPQIFSKQHR
jgi:hypothetical protein